MTASKTGVSSWPIERSTSTYSLTKRDDHDVIGRGVLDVHALLGEAREKVGLEAAEGEA